MIRRLPCRSLRRANYQHKGRRIVFQEVRSLGAFLGNNDRSYADVCLARLHRRQYGGQFHAGKLHAHIQLPGRHQEDFEIKPLQFAVAADVAQGLQRIAGGYAHRPVRAGPILLGQYLETLVPTRPFVPCRLNLRFGDRVEGCLPFVSTWIALGECEAECATLQVLRKKGEVGITAQRQCGNRVIAQHSICLPGLQRQNHIRHIVVGSKRPNIRGLATYQLFEGHSGDHGHRLAAQVGKAGQFRLDTGRGGGRLLSFQHRHHRTAGVVRFGEYHALFPLRRDVDARCRKVTFSRLHCGQNAVVVHVNNFQTIVTSLTEQRGQFHVVAHHCAIAHILEGRVARFRRQPKRSVFGTQGLDIRHGFRVLVLAEPLGRQRIQRPLGQLCEEGVELIPQGLSRLSLWENERESIVVQVFGKIGDLSVFPRQKLSNRLVHHETIHLVSGKRGHQARLGIVIVYLRIRQVFRHDRVKARARLYADTLAVQLRQRGVNGAGHGVRILGLLSIVAHHRGDFNFKQYVGKGYRFILLIRVEQVRHDTVNAAGLGCGNDTAKVIHLEFQLCAEPMGKPAGQLDVVSRKLRTHVIGIGHHCARRAHAQRKRRAFRFGEFRHDLFAPGDPAIIHLVQRAIRFLLRNKGVQPALQIGNRRYRGDAHSDLVRHIIFIQQTHAGKPMINGKLHLASGIDAGVDAAVGHIQVSHEYVAVGDQLRPWIVFLQRGFRRRIQPHGNDDSRLREVIQGSDGRLRPFCMA